MVADRAARTDWDSALAVAPPVPIMLVGDPTQPAGPDGDVAAELARRLGGRRGFTLLPACGRS